MGRKEILNELREGGVTPNEKASLQDLLNQLEEMKNAQAKSDPIIHPYKVPGVVTHNEVVREDLRVVNFMGRAPSGLVIPPHGEIWGVNHSWAYGHKMDKLFIMDGWKAMLNECKSDGIPEEDYLNYLRESTDTQIIGAFQETMFDNKGDKVRTMDAFPKDVTTSLIPGTYFTSTIAHVLAYVAAQEALGFKKIDTLNIYGIEIWASFDEDEYNNQAPCVDFWIPYLYGKGIQVMVPSYLMFSGRSKNNMYGYVRKGPRYQ
jgi:hypothetical protein